MSKIIIIGGGASGLVAAITAAKNNNEVILLERNNTCGKKLLITGNGHCNYWNSNQDLNNYHSSSPLIEDIITPSNLNTVSDFLTNLGLVPKIKNGYYYPLSNQASSIKNTLYDTALRHKVLIKENFLVENITKKNNTFFITSSTETLTADKVIIATGSKSAPKTGSTGTGYTLLQRMHHTILPVLPALVKLHTEDKILSSLAGVRCDAHLSLYENNKLIATEQGEVQFNKDTISGICTFNLSYYASTGLAMSKEEVIHLNFLPFLKELSSEELLSWFNSRNRMLQNPSLTQLLEPLLNYKIINYFLKKLKFSLSTTWQDLTIQEKNKLLSLLTNYPLVITATASFDEAQTCTGGVPLDEINTATMESKLIANLYIVGELLDVTGNCGGYNLTFAFISGYLAGRSASC